VIQKLSSRKNPLPRPCQGVWLAVKKTQPAWGKRNC
jgi:hypothetical protein